MDYSESELKLYLNTVAKAGENPDDYAYVPDKDHPSTWKLQIQDAKHVGGAVAALGPGGFRGQKVDIPSDAIAGVKRKVLAAWRKFHPDAKPEDEPDHLKKGLTMTPEEMQTELTKFEGQLSETNKRAERLEQVIKLSSDERAYFDPLPVEKQDEYLKADAATREGLLKAGKKKAPADNMDDGEPDEDDVEKRIEKKLAVERQEFQKKLDAVQKDAEGKIAAAETIAKQEREAREKTEFAKRAESELSNYPGTPEEKGAALQALHGSTSKCMTKEQVESIGKLLNAGNAALGQTMTSVGGDGVSKGAGNDAWGQIEKKAKDMVSKSEGKLTLAKAVEQVIKAEPELYVQYEKERTAAARQ
jgi:hypothetical protein